MLVLGLLQEPTSRLHAAHAGWVYAPADRDLFLHDYIDVELMKLGARGSAADSQHRPWLGESVRRAPVISDEVRAKLKARRDFVLGGSDD